MDELSKEEVGLAAGPGAFADEGIAPRPMLEGASDQEYADVVNLLSVDFIGKVAQSRPVNAPVNISISSNVPGMTRSENDVRNNYGLDLRNPDHQGKAHIVNKIVLRAGETKRLPGNVASVVVGQLVSEIMARRGQKLQLADLFARHHVETEVIVSRGLINDLMSSAPMSAQERIDIAMKEQPHEEFPDLNGSTGATPEGRPDSAGDSETVQKRPGRPRTSEATS